ncbi:histidine phosphatase family protein [Salinibaculum salinum]|uniref:histidine phosphatase family protein n=1 Tax=Salinibaculum salinum TaxID=3131996 RepID=UPI0030EE8B92
MPDGHDTTRLVLVRHGETDWNRDSRIQGWAPSSLTNRGREQARTLGAHLRESYEFDRLVASDLRRTRETTALLRDEGVQPEPNFDRAWRERCFGVYQGLTKTEIFEGHPEFAPTTGVSAVRATPENGESLLDVRERVLAGWEQLLADADGETVLVVTHGGPITLLLGDIRGDDIFGAITDHSQHNCAINELHVSEAVEIIRHNETV